MATESDLEARLRLALEQLAAQDAAGLIAEARAEARARARSILAEALTQTMLEQAQRELESSSPAPTARRVTPPHKTQLETRPGPAPAPPAPSSPAGHGWYVYCVLEADAPGPPGQLAGIDPNATVTTLPAAGLSAVASQVPLAEFDEERLREHLGDMAWVERVARRHEEVLEAVGAGTTVIPMRLCTIYRDEAGVEAMLRREADPMRAALTDLRDRAEWGVKVFALPRLRTAPTASDGEEDSQLSGAAYMERRRREQQEHGQVDEDLIAACEVIHARLSAIAARALVVPPQRPEVSGHEGEMILNGVYLIDDSQRDTFHDAVGALQSEYGVLGLELVPTGPWPAYNFVPDAIGATP